MKFSNHFKQTVRFAQKILCYEAIQLLEMGHIIDSELLVANEKNSQIQDF